MKLKTCRECKHFANDICYSQIFCRDGSQYTPKEKSSEVKETDAETVNHPAHYQGNRECIDVMVDMFGVEAVKDFCRCNSFKYRFRADKKNGDEDIQKAEWYENKLHELESVKNEDC